MTTTNVLITVLLTLIALAALLYWWLIKHFTSMSEEEKEIYEQNCPFDNYYCDTIGRSITDQYITKTCEKCSRYKNLKK